MRAVRHLSCEHQVGDVSERPVDFGLMVGPGLGVRIGKWCHDLRLPGLTDTTQGELHDRAVVVDQSRRGLKAVDRGVVPR